MARAKKKKITSANDIVSLYMEYILEQEVVKNNVHNFCKHHKIDETIFYNNFGSIEALEKSIWNQLMKQSITTASYDKDYAGFNEQEKLLSILYTFFENLTLNRSYITENLKNNAGLKERIDLFSLAKKTFTHFVDEEFQDVRMAMSQSHLPSVDNIRKRAFREGFWVQVRLLIEFWRKDESKGFEKTDLAIEKSARAAIDLLDANPVNSFIDLGKFLWKEHINN